MNTPFTYSNYSALRKCGQYFKLAVIDRLPQPPAVALEFGSAIHAAINASLTGSSTEEAQDVFEAFWDSVTTKLDFSEERYKAEEMRQIGIKFVGNFAKRYGAKMKLIVGEQRMKSELKRYSDYYGEQVIQPHIEGTPDTLVEYLGKNVLLDFKTSAYNYDPLKTDISLQLNLYAWLLEQNGYKVDALCYVVFNKGTGSIQTPHIIPYDRKKALAMIEEAVQYWKREQGHYEKNGNACVMGKHFCPYVGECWK
jgi:ATP-dependent exoDNAse (exonuclease V) beta subunit